jgi:hypothetical protein
MILNPTEQWLMDGCCSVWCLKSKVTTKERLVCRTREKFYHKYTETYNTKQSSLKIVVVLQIQPESGIAHLHSLVL